MVIDTSAVMALLLNEPERDQIVRILTIATSAKLSAGNWIELSAVLTRRTDELRPGLAITMQRFSIIITPVALEQAELGHDAHRRYGRGTGHPARLNFGDCFAYALAKALGEPLLFKGDDFARTDVTPAR